MDCELAVIGHHGTCHQRDLGRAKRRNPRQWRGRLIDDGFLLDTKEIAAPAAARQTEAAARREAQPRSAASIVAISIFLMVIIASNARLALSPPAAIAWVSTRGVICHDTPHLSLHHPHALSCPPLPTMAFQ